ncbi:MAG: class I SAM-dependent methyltransferase [Akkermansiaceae bacterium]
MHPKQSSDTAKLVARSIALASKDQDLAKLLPIDAAEITTSLDPIRGGWFTIAWHSELMRWAFFKAMDFMVPGIVAHYVIRKRAIETEVRHALSNGATQLVILGAGYDTLAWRLSKEFEKVNFVEFDHPATQAAKKAKLGNTKNFHYNAVDLEKKSFKSAVAECRDIQPDVPTVVVAEGLTMYLPEQAVTNLIGDLSGLAGLGGRVIFTFMEKDNDGSIHFRDQQKLVEKWLGWRSERFLWGTDRKNLACLLDTKHLQKVKILDHSDLRTQFLEPLGIEDLRIARGECLCYCSPSPDV